MTNAKEESRDETILDGLADGIEICNHAHSDDDDLDDILDDIPSKPRRDDRMELPDDPPGTVYTECYGDPPSGYDDLDYIYSPVLPNDAMAALRDAGGLLHDFARGKVLPPDEAGQAAWRAVRMLEKYGAELTEEWYLDVDEWRRE